MTKIKTALAAASAWMDQSWRHKLVATGTAFELAFLAVWWSL